MAEALDRYETYYREERGAKPRTIEVEIDRVGRLLGTEGPLRQFGPEGAAAAYRALRASTTQYNRPPSDAEHQACLKAGRRFGKFLVREKLWRTNPLKDVPLVGRPKRGEESKPQLSIDQGRIWLDGALAAFEMGDQSALAAAVLIVMGPRVSEVASRRVSHLDAGGTLLRIPKGKTAKAKRDLEIPYPCPEHPHAPDLRTPLQQQAARARAWGRAQEVAQLDPPLFPPVPYVASGTPVNGEHLSRFSVRRTVHRICRAVGLPLVCPHALRGTFASSAVRTGAAVWAVADALGQAGEQVTRRHYATTDAQAAGQGRALLRVIGDSPRTPQGTGDGES